MNIEKFNEVVKESGITKAFLADKLCVSRQGMYYKLKTGSFTISEAFKCKELLRLTDVEFNEIFLG